ncbi:MAG: succinylglutamate desuccinylase/aspartoacylase family protein, partial [Deltaproteobacteria bacterium]|nr:succinylglutamate desuccinylase/aspartoacylase family protein [Deltaproteobacteria bacterium]
LKGIELNGLEIANRIIKSVSASQIRGTIIAIPVLNVYGLTHYPATSPTGSNLETCFPGNEKGSYGERIAHLVTQEILKKADYCIELETGGWNHNILPQVYCNFDNKRAKELAKVFKSPVVTNVSLEGNHLRQTTEELQVPLLVYEAGEAMRFDENAITLGVDSIKNVMRKIDMLSDEPVQEVTPIFSKEEGWIIAHKGGILHPSVSLGQTIEKGDIIGTISDPFGADIVEPIKSPKKGIVVGVNTAPLIHEGLEIFKIASFSDYDKAETTIEEWDSYTTGHGTDGQ